MSDVKMIIWTNIAKDQLKTIFNYYKEKSVQGADNVKKDILNATRNLHFSTQYQKDEIESEYRRIIVRDYKILYKEIDEIIYVIKIISLKRNINAQL